MLSFQTVLPDTLELLRVLMNIPFFKDTRLVGGTSLALQYGHRRSVDLDLFGNFPDDDDEMVELFRNLRLSVKIGQRSSFADADPMPMPEMFTNDSWMDMKSSIIDSVKAYNNKKCGKKYEY